MQCPPPCEIRVRVREAKFPGENLPVRGKVEDLGVEIGRPRKYNALTPPEGDAHDTGSGERSTDSSTETPPTNPATPTDASREKRGSLGSNVTCAT